jgi:hypothetical protein
MTVRDREGFNGEPIQHSAHLLRFSLAKIQRVSLARLVRRASLRYVTLDFSSGQCQSQSNIAMHIADSAFAVSA